MEVTEKRKAQRGRIVAIGNDYSKKEKKICLQA
jgi:co-chaperonin GroES (HSP10)